MCLVLIAFRDKVALTTVTNANYSNNAGSRTRCPHLCGRVSGALRSVWAPGIHVRLKDLGRRQDRLPAQTGSGPGAAPPPPPGLAGAPGCESPGGWASAPLRPGGRLWPVEGGAGPESVPCTSRSSSPECHRLVAHTLRAADQAQRPEIASSQQVLMLCDKHPRSVSIPRKETSPPPNGLSPRERSRTWPHCNYYKSLAVTERIGQRLTACSSGNKDKKKALSRHRPQRSVYAAHAGVGARGTDVARGGGVTWRRRCWAGGACRC